MIKWFKGLWARLTFWRQPPKVVAPKPSVIIGEDYLKGYQSLYKDFQGQFVGRIRANPDALYWQSMSIEEIGVIAGDWVLTNGRGLKHPNYSKSGNGAEYDGAD